MAVPSLNRRQFVHGATVAGGGLAMSGPLSALSARSAVAQSRGRAIGYGPLYPTPEKDSGLAYLALPRGFQYRILNRSFDPSIAYPTRDGGPQQVPTPTAFDGMGAFPGPRGTTILIRNHENRGDANEEVQEGVPVVVPPEDRYDQSPAANAGNTRLVVGRNRRLLEPPLHVLGGTAVNCAGGEMPWGSWLTCEETDDELGEPHGYIFEVPAGAERPVKAVPIKQAGRFAHEAVAWHDGILYETEDVREDSAFYRYRPQQRVSRFGDLARSSGPLEALAIERVPAADADLLEVGRPYKVHWVPVAEPDPDLEAGAPTTRAQARSGGATFFDRLEGCWEADGRIYFDATEGGKPDAPNARGTATTELGQIFEYDPQRRTLTLLFESPNPQVLQNPDNLVVVPTTGHLFLQEDSPDEQFIRGLTREGLIYDFARSIINDSEFAGGCFSADGGTFFVNQQGGDEQTADDSDNGLTYAIWGPFARARNGAAGGEDDDDRNGRGRGGGKGGDKD